MSKLHFSKIVWIFRAAFYKIFFEQVGLLSYIGKPVFLQGVKRICIGKKVRIFPGIRMEAIENGYITIEDNVYIGQNCHITSKGSNLLIGKGTAIMANVFITNINHKYKEIGIPLLEQGDENLNTIIGKNSFIGQGAAIQAGVKLGEQTIVGANAVVLGGGGYPDCCVLVGVPARVVKIYDKTKRVWVKYKE